MFEEVVDELGVEVYFCLVYFFGGGGDDMWLCD